MYLPSKQVRAYLLVLLVVVAVLLLSAFGRAPNESVLTFLGRMVGAVLGEAIGAGVP